MSFGDFNPTSQPPTANAAATGLSTRPFEDTAQRSGGSGSGGGSGGRPIQLARTTPKGNTPPPGQSIPRSASPVAPENSAITQGRRVWDRASQAIFTISNNVASLDALVKLLGGPKDSPELRQRLHELTENTRDMIKQTGADLKSLVIPENTSNFEGRQHKMAQQKLQKDFESVLARFQNVSKIAAKKSAEYVQKARNHQKQQQLQAHENDDNDNDNENAPLLQQQAETLDAEVEYNESLIQEREQDLQNIERSIIEVNEIFRDLGTIVGEQQYMFDHIESNVGQVAINVEGATNELRIAAERQKAAQNRMCCLYTVLGAIGLIVVLVILR